MNERISELHLATPCRARCFLFNIEQITSKEVFEAKKILNAEDIQKAKKFIFTKDCNRSLIIYAMIKLSLGKILAITPSCVSFLRNPFGKPFIPGNPLHFNWSHSDSYAFLGVHPTRPIGVDIEKVRETINLDGFLFPEEQRWLSQLSETMSEKYCALWSAKEAYVKALGIGFSQSIPLLEMFKSQKNLLYFHAYLSGFSSSVVESYSNVVKNYKLATCLV